MLVDMFTFRKSPYARRCDTSEGGKAALEKLGLYLAFRPKRAAVLFLTLTVALILVLAGLLLELAQPREAPYPSDDLPLELDDNKVIYTQESSVGDFPYMGMKILFRASYGAASMTMPVADFGNQSQLSAGLLATTHQVLMTSSWTNASIDITDSIGDGRFGGGDTIVFELVPLEEDMVFTMGLLWTVGDGGGAIMEVSFVLHDGRLYAWFSQYLGDWYRPHMTYIRDQVLRGAVNFLCDNYNESVRLIHESPDHGLEDIYWIYSDNYLASIVLSNYDQRDLTLTRMAENITNAMQDHTAEIDLVNQYMVLTEALAVNISVFNNSANFNLTNVDGSQIKTTQNNQSGSLDPRNYSDIAFLQAIYFHELGMENESMTAYEYGLDSYDGKGFNDTPFTETGRYQTYKLALYIYASKQLGHDYDMQAFCTLLAMQRSNGGFVTEYGPSLQAISGTNTETTSLAILSLSM